MLHSVQHDNFGIGCRSQGDFIIFYVISTIPKDIWCQTHTAQEATGLDSGQATFGLSVRHRVGEVGELEGAAAAYTAVAFAAGYVLILIA
jgi:hypothetical protein